MELLVSFLIPDNFNKEYKQKSSVELLVCFLSYTFNKECEQKSSVELLIYFLIEIVRALPNAREASDHKGEPRQVHRHQSD